MSDERLQPGFPICRLWERTNPRGEVYLLGRMGGARVLILPNRNRNDGDDASHQLVIAPVIETRGPKKDRQHEDD